MGFINVTAEQDYHDGSQLGGPDARYFTQSGTLLPGLSPLVAAGVTAAPNSPDVNHQFGDASFDLYKLFYNAGYDFGGAKLYSFGSYGHRVAAAYENYRDPSIVTGVTSNGATVVPFPEWLQPSGSAERGRLFVHPGPQGHRRRLGLGSVEHLWPRQG